MSSGIKLLILVAFTLCFVQIQCVSFVEYFDDYNGYLVIPDNTTIGLVDGVKLTTNATSVKHGDYLQLHWEGVTPTYNASDYIALYTPGNMPTVQSKVASKYIYANDVPGFNNYGNGTYVFHMVSSRASWIFAFVQGDPDYPVIIGLSDPIQLINPNEPLHGHVGITGDQNQVTVQWNTRDVSGGESVQYGTSPGQYTQTVKPFQSVAYSPSDLSGGIANSTGYVYPGLTHTAILQVKPDTKYYYKYGSSAAGFGYSKEYTFRSLPPVGTDETVYLFATADVGSSGKDNTSLVQNEYASRQNLKYLMRDIQANDKYSLYHLHGDIAYADGTLTIWDNYWDEWQDFLSSVPVVVTEGNHERDWRHSGDRFNDSLDNSGGEIGVPTYTFFFTPNQVAGKGQKQNLWYSFDYGPIHFVHFSTERPFNIGSDQWNFMANDIKKVNRSITPWLVVAGHRPTYTSSSSCCSQDSNDIVASDMKAAFEDLFFQNHVDIVWNGHVHRYELTLPVYKNQTYGYDKDGVPQAPIYMTLGMGGYSLSLDIIKPKPSYYAKTILANGYTRLRVNKTSFIQEAVYALNGTLMDTFTMTKPADWGSTYMKSHPI